MSRILEELPGLVPNIDALREDALALPSRFPRADRGKDGLLGWSLLSASGEVFDGFAGWEYLEGEKTESATAGNFDLPKAIREGYRIDYFHDRETPACTGALASLVHQLRDLGLHPRRARISLVPPGHHVPAHVDGSTGEYFVRLHIPLSTNPGAKFKLAGEAFHLPANGSGYFFSATTLHEIYNEGPTPRLHFIATIWDVSNVTKNFRCSERDFEKTLASAAKFKRLVGAIG